MKYQTAMWIALCAMFLFVGYNWGMISQQMATRATIEEFASSLNGVQIDIDLNETQMIKGITDFYEPYFEDIIDESKGGVYDDGEVYMNRIDSKWYMNINDTTFTWDVEENIWYEVEDVLVALSESGGKDE